MLYDLSSKATLRFCLNGYKALWSQLIYESLIFQPLLLLEDHTLIKTLFFLVPPKNAPSLNIIEQVLKLLHQVHLMI